MHLYSHCYKNIFHAWSIVRRLERYTFKIVRKFYRALENISKHLKPLIDLHLHLHNTAYYVLRVLFKLSDHTIFY